MVCISSQANIALGNIFMLEFLHKKMNSCLHTGCSSSFVSLQSPVSWLPASGDILRVLEKYVAGMLVSDDGPL